MAKQQKVAPNNKAASKLTQLEDAWTYPLPGKNKPFGKIAWVEDHNLPDITAPISKSST